MAVAGNKQFRYRGVEKIKHQEKTKRCQHRQLEKIELQGN